ncbi:F-box multi-domain protein [Pyrenophora tritici-repentis]|nr:F-box multi-domain protein [Pyrenophora tritici-repentis]
MTSSHSINPLTVLPPELVLRVLEYTPISDLASLLATSRAWYHFIDNEHTDTIYSSPSKTSQPRQISQLPTKARANALCARAASFSKLFDGVSSWKQLCERQQMIKKAWARPRPLTRQSVLQVKNSAVWRFKTDFKRRLIISTSHDGGLHVSDMDTGHLLWELPSSLLTSEDDSVEPHAHLEYDDGTAAFNKGDVIELWRADVGNTARGEFRRVTTLDPGCQIRGFQLSYNTLCAVSADGLGFVYDLSQAPPSVTRLEIEKGAIGHLDQNEDMVVFSMGWQGYHAYDKKTGVCLGRLEPWRCTEKYHAVESPTLHDTFGRLEVFAIYQCMTRPLYPPMAPREHRLSPVRVNTGPAYETDTYDDLWGAGMLDRGSDMFVGYSGSGCIFICQNIRTALESGAENLASHGQLLESKRRGSSLSLGGWLAVKNHRVMFEAGETMFIIALDGDNRVIVTDGDQSKPTSFATHIQVIDVLAPLSPVSIQSADATKNATATGGSQLRNWLVTEVITEEPSDDPGRAPWSVIKAEIKDPNSYDLGIGGNGRSVTSKARKHSVKCEAKIDTVEDTFFYNRAWACEPVKDGYWTMAITLAGFIPYSPPALSYDDIYLNFTHVVSKFNEGVKPQKYEAGGRFDLKTNGCNHGHDRTCGWRLNLKTVEIIPHKVSI